MELTYINADGRSITLKQSRPYFLKKIDGTGNIRQTVNTFKAPDQDGAFYISSTLDMRNITLESYWRVRLLLIALMMLMHTDSFSLRYLALS